MAEGDINTLFGKVAKLDQRVTKIEATQPFLTEILEKNVKTNERLAETLHEIRLSMVSMNDKIDAQATAIENMNSMKPIKRQMNELSLLCKRLKLSISKANSIFVNF